MCVRLCWERVLSSNPFVDMDRVSTHGIMERHCDAFGTKANVLNGLAKT